MRCSLSSDNEAPRFWMRRPNTPIVLCEMCPPAAVELTMIGSPPRSQPSAIAVLAALPEIGRTSAWRVFVSASSSSCAIVSTWSM